MVRKASERYLWTEFELYTLPSVHDPLNFSFLHERIIHVLACPCYRDCELNSVQAQLNAMFLSLVPTTL